MIDINKKRLKRNMLIFSNLFEDVIPDDNEKEKENYVKNKKDPFYNKYKTRSQEEIRDLIGDVILKNEMPNIETYKPKITPSGQKIK